MMKYDKWWNNDEEYESKEMNKLLNSWKIIIINDTYNMHNIR